MKKLLILSISFVVLLSCGPNAEQKAAMQKQHDDSVARVAAQNAQLAQQQADAAAAQAKEEREAANQNLRSYQQQLELYRADLSAANARMTEIQSEDCWLQSCKDRKVQNVRNQTLVIEHINDEITAVQNKMSDIKTKYNIQ